MIVRLNKGETPYKNCTALNQRAWRDNQTLYGDPKERTSTHQLTWRKLGYMLPLLWLSGVFFGVALTLMVKCG